MTESDDEIKSKIRAAMAREKSIVYCQVAIVFSVASLALSIINIYAR